MRRRRLFAAGAIALVLLGVVVTRAVWQGGAALDRGDAALATGDTGEAIRWWRRAARWYVPAAPHVDAAYQRMAELGRAADARGDRATALAAWQAVRSSILSTRSFYVPFEELLEPANHRIAVLMAAVEPATTAPGTGPAEREAWHYAALARDEAPAVGWTLVALLGFALWIGGAARFAWSGVDAEDRLVGRVAGRAGLMVAAGLVIWMFGLYYA